MLFRSDTKKAGRSADKTIEMIPSETADLLKHMVENGWIFFGEGNNKTQYGVSEENIRDLIDPEVINAEMLDRFLAKLKADGIEFKYKKNSDWVADGKKFADPAKA